MIAFPYNPWGTIFFYKTNAVFIKKIKILVGNSLAKRDITLVTDSKRAQKPINGRHLSGC